MLGIPIDFAIRHDQQKILCPPLNKCLEHFLLRTNIFNTLNKIIPVPEEPLADLESVHRIDNLPQDGP